MIEKPINTSIGDSDWTAVSLGSGQTCSSYAFQSRDGSTFKVSDTPDGAEYFTVRDGAIPSMKQCHGVAGMTLFYAKAVSGTTVIEVFILDE